MKILRIASRLFLLLFFTGCFWACKSTSVPGEHKKGETAFELTPPLVKPLPIVWKEEWESGSTTPGDHTQHMLGMAYCEADPDRIYMAQDVSNVWVSRDFGKDWFTLQCEGLYSPFIVTVEVDPLDKNRVLAAAGCRRYDAANRAYQGIYLSTDGGITWHRQATRRQLTEVRSMTHLLAYAPTSKDKNKGYVTRWYAAFCDGGPQRNTDDGLLTSDDGGETWMEVRKLPGSVYGDMIRGIKVDKRNPDKLFLYGDQGLFRFEDATNEQGAVTRLSGEASSGLPEGSIWGSLYQSDDGQTLIVAVSQRGIYKSINGGAGWSLLYDWDKVNYCYVNEKHPDRLFAVPIAKGGEQLRISKDAGETWTSPADESVHYRPGYDRSNWVIKLNGQFSYVLPDPRDPDKVFMHTNSKNFRSEDGGRTWHASDNGFNGAQHTGIWQEQMFDPVNPDRFAYFMIDKGVNYTDTRGRWFYDNQIVPKKLGLQWKTSMAGALHPTKPVILAFAGTGAIGELLRSPDNGKTWSVVSDGNKERWVIAFDLKDPDYCYQWRERSSDAGKTWTEMTNMPARAILCGVARSDGRILYAMQSGKKIWRSTDRGDTWQLVIDPGWDLTFPGPNEAFIFRVNPKNPNIVYTNSATNQVTQWDLSSLPARPTAIVFPGGTEPNFCINRFAIDPRYPEVMYALNLRANTGHKFFRTIDGGATWENISRYATQGSVNGLAVSPVTGEVYISSQNGSLVMLPPYPTSHTAYEVVPYKSNHLSEPYD